MRTFIYVFLLVLLSILLAAFLFYVSLWLAWGRLFEVSTGMNLSLFIAGIFFILGLYYLTKKETLKKVLISNAIIFAFLAPITYIYLFKDNSKLYSYDNYPCKNELISSDRNIIQLVYAGTSMKGFEIFTKYNLEDEKYYNIIKNRTSHIYKKTYPIGSKWKVLGLYEHTRYNLNYFLLSSIDDKEKAWVYTNNFNYKECKIEALDRETPFEIYTAVGSRKSIEF
jgi:hypothetical protein